jgi:hypothetical protein
MSALIDASRCVALAKLEEFERQCRRLAALVRQGGLAKDEAIDHLQRIADAHALPQAHGAEKVQAILEDAFADADFRPMRAEVA